MSRTLQFILIFAALLALVTATATAASLINKSSKPFFGHRTRVETFPTGSAYPPSEWIAIERASASDRIKLTFALKLRNLDLLEKTLLAVSDPLSTEYGKHLSRAEIAEMVAPSEQTVQNVVQWIQAECSGEPTTDFYFTTPSRDFLVLETTVQQAEQLLRVQYSYFQHVDQLGKKDALTLLRSAEPDYTLPQSVASSVDFIGGVSRFPTLRRRSASASSLRATADLTVDPTFLKKLYGVGDTVAPKGTSNSQGVAQFLGQHYLQGDLEEFFLMYSRVSLGNKPTVVGPNSFPAGIEASLDIEYIMAMSTNTPTTFWSTAGEVNGQEPFLEWATAVDNMTDTDLVRLFSVSYGDVESSLSAEYMTRINAEFAKLGARGVSILFASGDDGVGGDFSSKCKQFEPNFPATSPWVTAVGGTAMSGVAESGHEVCNGLSGGGFSNVFPQPSYQTAAVQHYFATVGTNAPASSYYNISGRSYPDVSALSAGFIVVANKIPEPGVAGTSCASPTFAGVVSLLNENRVSKGKPTLGFLNPLIYSNPSMLNDITEGSNPGCNTNGFPAVQGYDPSTGWGSPNFGAMSTVVNNLP